MAPGKGRHTQLGTTAQSRLSLEEEILSLKTLYPETMAELPAIFAECVVDSASSILGEATGEALVRHIGDAKLRDPEAVYASLDSFLQGGSGDMRGAIVQAFRMKVHGVYKLTMKIAQDSLTSVTDGAPGITGMRN
jgi:hypothetical protein